MLYQYFNFNKNNKSLQQRGFGLIELMVSISVMLIVSSIILARNDSFNGAVLLRNQAYEIAFSAREIQLSAVSTSALQGGFRSLLGLHFSTVNDSTYRIFKDSNPGNNYHDTSEEFGKQGNIDNRFYIRAIRVDGTPYTAVSVVFERPNFDARFFSGANTQISNAQKIEIDIARRGVSGTGAGVVRTLEITATGQIAVQ
jgi:prepilin-type N-terminal cleavage/methylation domain-containing protein